MHKLLCLAIVAIFLFTPAAWADQQELKLFNWSENIDPEILVNFEKEFGIKVREDLYESNEEMMAKLQAGGVSQYDIIVPSDYILPSLVHLKLIQPLDHAKLPNIVNLSEKFKKVTFDQGNRYSVGYQWGTVGLMYDPEKIKNFAPTWAMLFDPARNPGPFLLIDSARESVGIALKYLGYSLNSSDPDQVRQAAKLLLDTKKRPECLGFEGGVGGKNKVVAGVASAAVVYNGDALRAIEENPSLKFVMPKEGGEIWLDNLAIPAQAPNPDAAHQFINYILRPDVAAKLANFMQYGTPNQEARKLIKPEDLNNPTIYPPEETMEVLEFVNDLGKANRLYDEIWTMIKSR